MFTLVLLQKKIKKLMARKAFSRNCNVEEFEEMKEQMENQTKEITAKIKRLEAKTMNTLDDANDDAESQVSELTPEEQEQIRKINLDFWLGKVMAKFPQYFYDLEHKKANRKFYQNVRCKNCL